MMRKIDGIIFDVDGTLWDAVPAVCQAWRDEVAEQGYDYVLEDERMKSLFGQQVDTFGDVLFADLSLEERRRLAHDCCDHQIARMRENRLLYPYEGVAETLRKLAETYPLFVVTNAENGYTQLFLEVTGTTECIRDFEHAGVPGRSKADNIRLVMERNGLRNALYVGDTTMDQRSSQEAGARFVWASYGFGENVENELRIDSFSELPELLSILVENPFSLNPYIVRVQEQGIQMDAILVMQHGEVLGRHDFKDYGVLSHGDDPANPGMQLPVVHNVYSIAKSFLTTAIGMAIEEGLMTITDRPVDYFADILPEKLDSRWQDVTLEHLLTMTSGHGKSHMMAVERQYLRGEGQEKVEEATRKEWLLYAFACPMVYQPGEKFVYGNLAPYVAGRMLEKATGRTLLDYLYDKLWKPMGAEKPRWDADPSGHTFPASDLFLDVDTMAKLGQLYLDKGLYQGIRYLSESWVEKATSNILPSEVINPTGNAPEEKQGYGYYFWQNSDGGCRAYGKLGQLILILPEKDAVIVSLGNHRDAQQVFDVIKGEIYPQL